MREGNLRTTPQGSPPEAVRFGALRASLTSNPPALRSAKQTMTPSCLTSVRHADRINRAAAPASSSHKAGRSAG